MVLFLLFCKMSWISEIFSYVKCSWFFIRWIVVEYDRFLCGKSEGFKVCLPLLFKKKKETKRNIAFEGQTALLQICMSLCFNEISLKIISLKKKLKSRHCRWLKLQQFHLVTAVFYTCSCLHFSWHLFMFLASTHCIYTHAHSHT